MANILIVDDDRMLCDILCLHLEKMGHTVEWAHCLADGVKVSQTRFMDIVFLDVNLPDGNGLDVLPVLRGTPSVPEVIIFTGEGDPDGAEVAIKNGAWDYIEKPVMVKEMMLPLIRALEYRSEKKKHLPKTVLKRTGIVGSSPAIEICLDAVAEAASSEENVLITGETGTGKELFARAIHKNSKRQSQKFVVLDCAAMPEALVENLLFGHQKGAFTGADKATSGLIEQADGGTLFLDEVGELPLTVQKSFLRVIQEKSFRSLGGQREKPSDFRLLAATHRDLDEMVQKGKFRSDLFFRLRVFGILLPPLKNRSGDINEIAFHHLEKLASRNKTGVKGMSPEFIESLNLYDWPGNVRELLGAIERAFINAKGDPTLFPLHLPVNIRITLARQLVMKKSGNKTSFASKEFQQKHLPTLKAYREEAVSNAEKEYLKRVMMESHGDIETACGISGVSQSRLYYLLKKYHHFIS